MTMRILAKLRHIVYHLLYTKCYLLTVLLNVVMMSALTLQVILKYDLLLCHFGECRGTKREVFSIQFFVLFTNVRVTTYEKCLLLMSWI